MGNHFHVLVETPEPNLVAGMKWFLGVYSQGWNRRRQRHGHVFQGRYKAVVVNGEERDGSYFKIVADYIHLNPVRAGSVGGTTERKLRNWRWRKRKDAWVERRWAIDGSPGARAWAKKAVCGRLPGLTLFPGIL
jgi:REP element-mobilizing transposase RayT